MRGILRGTARVAYGLTLRPMVSATRAAFNGVGGAASTLGRGAWEMARDPRVETTEAPNDKALSRLRRQALLVAYPCFLVCAVSLYNVGVGAVAGRFGMIGALCAAAITGAIAWKAAWQNYQARHYAPNGLDVTSFAALRRWMASPLEWLPR